MTTTTPEPTLTGPSPGDGSAGLRSGRPHVWIGVAILLAVLTAFGLLVARSDVVDVPADVRDVQEAWFAAWNAEDGDAVLAMMQPGGRHYCPMTGASGVAGADLAAFVERGWQMTDAAIVSVTRSPAQGYGTAVDDDYVVVTSFTLNGRPGYLSVLHLLASEGSLRVHEHHAYP